MASGSHAHYATVVFIAQDERECIDHIFSHKPGT